jgi:hypothetical protein
MDVYDEACQAIRLGLSAYAVAVMDPSQFHLFYPSLQNSSTGGTSARDRSTSGPIRSTTSKSPRRTGSGRRSPNPTTEAILTDETDIYAQTRRAKQTCSVADSLAPSRTPQVLFMHSRPRGSKALQSRHQDGVSRLTVGSQTKFSKQLAVLGYSRAHDSFTFNFMSSPAVRKIISDFMAKCQGGYSIVGISVQIR